MRIRGSGHGASGFGGGWSRSDSFRNKHRLGQKVRGILLKNVENGMAWVEIDGDRLLAQLEVTHAEGSRLTFIIKQLTPNIILKELPLNQGNGGGVSVLGLASGFDTARTLFENRFNPIFRESEFARTSLNMADFLKLTTKDAKLFTLYRDALNCANGLSNALGEAGGRFLYQPWFVPDSRRQVTFIRPNNTSDLLETVIEFDHAQLGMVRAEFLHKGTKVACKLKMQHISQSKPLMRYLASRAHPNLHMDIENLGIIKLPQQSHGGIIAESLFKQ